MSYEMHVMNVSNLNNKLFPRLSHGKCFVEWRHFGHLAREGRTTRFIVDGCAISVSEKILKATGG